MNYSNFSIIIALILFNQTDAKYSPGDSDGIDPNQEPQRCGCSFSSDTRSSNAGWGLAAGTYPTTTPGSIGEVTVYGVKPDGTHYNGPSGPATAVGCDAPLACTPIEDKCSLTIAINGVNVLFEGGTCKTI